MNHYEDLDKKIDACLNADRLPFHTTKEEAWQNITSRLPKAKVVDLNRSRVKPWIKLAVAASIVIASLGFVLDFLGNNNFNSGSTISEVQLPDGSEVTLDHQSSVVFNDFTWSLNRSVELKEGKAFFEVKKGEKFTVQTNYGIVEVLGTSFDVDITSGGLIVACKTGKVKVSNNSNDVYLLPGDAVELNNQGLQNEKIPIEYIGGWIRGEYNFENVHVSEVLEIIGDQKDLEIDFQSELDLVYTGQFNMNQSLEQILDIICLPTNLQYKIHPTDKKITITKI